MATLPAKADELRPGYLELNEQADGIWQLGWKLPLLEAPTGVLPAPIIPENCVYSGEPEVGSAGGSGGGAITGSAALQCTGQLGGQTLGMNGLLGQADMLVRIAPRDTPAQALRLTARDPAVMIATTPGTLQVLRTYFVLGVEHILAGWDHLLFVIALLLLVRSWRMVVLAATAFTAAHSVTLAAAVLGFVGLPQKLVEALIALSIVFLALEIIRQNPAKPTVTRRFPWIVAFVFGLLHGFGFAGALTAIGLPQGDVAPALLAFNVGVEAGQLLVIAGILGVLALLNRYWAKAEGPAIQIAAYGIGIIGSYWLIDRTIT